MAPLRWEPITSIVPLLLTVVAACHAGRPPTVARPTVERRAAAQPAAEPPAPKHAGDDDDEIGPSVAKRPEYAAFFDTLKRKLFQNWEPSSVWRRVDPKGTVYGTRTRITELRVSLSRSGEVAKIYVTSPSGVKELDDEAVRAFRSSAPFPAPPEGLIRTDDLVTFPFSFFFDARGPNVKSRTPMEVKSGAPSNAPVRPLPQQAVAAERSSGLTTTTDAQLESVAAVEGSKMPLPTSPCIGKYTPEARAAATEGVVVLDLIVDELGRTRDITVVEGLPHGLNESAIAALRACSFTPGEKDGKPVPVRVRGFKVRFLLHPTQ